MLTRHVPTPFKESAEHTTHQQTRFMSRGYFRLGATFASFLLAAFLGSSHAAQSVNAVIDLSAGPVHTFIPALALGAGVDGHSRGDGDAIYRRATLRAMRSTGLGPLAYRLRTELGIEAWHWNPRGRWSDAANNRGYWTSDDRPGSPILASYGYRLPRRGNTIDQAENNGYSRLVDGDLTTFWKSNPYLDRRYTGEDNRLHPQWVIVDFGQRTPVNALRIAWGQPYAVRYTVQYWDGEDPQDPDEYPAGRWQAFPSGEIADGRGDNRALRLSEQPIPVRFLRVLLQESSASAPPAAKDPRDALGYAIREIHGGTLDASGQLKDAVRHGDSRDSQTRIFVSSTDPWHRATDLDREVEQPGVDRVFASGLTRGLPVLMAVGALYDTPDNAAALLRYLKRRGYPLRGVEIGEEPDGQYTAPEDYGALYLQTVAALRAVDANTPLGGPSFQTLWDEPMMAWSGAEAIPDRPWLARFLNYLDERHRLSALSFLSFEWYPFDDVCTPPADQLRQAPSLLAAAITELHRQGLPRDLPLYMTEYGYSAFSAQAEVEVTGALFNADAVGTFLTLGGATAYLYGYEPSPIYQGPGCDTWGNNTLFLSDENRRIIAPTATYHAAVLLNQRWIGNPTRSHEVFELRLDTDASHDPPPLNGYALRRPDHRWALLLVNKDPARSWNLDFSFLRSRTTTREPLRGPADLYQFSAAQYRWGPRGERGRPLRSRPAAHIRLPERQALKVRLPPWSLTVIRAQGPAIESDLPDF
ncbi:MAG: discoidin domain-containing protein [Candidatus Competibacter sp.]|nr:discoidin domain-containing protein [Candidatus Competibacteraceae bacterium]